ncbi:hypothetical protein ACXR2T_10745 [Leucobacter sp. HY1910]
MSRPLGLKRPKLTKAQEQQAYDAVTERDVGQCQRCGSRGPVDRDHRQNRNPFNTTPAGLQLLGSSKAVGGCGCHEWKTRNVAQALKDGFSAPRWADPREWPAYRVCEGWVLYLDKPDRFGRWWVPISEEEANELLDELLGVSYG